MEEEALREPFERWLAQRWSDAEDLRVGAFRSPKSGFSARSFFVPVSYRRGGEAREEQVVLRIENPEPPIYPQQTPELDVEIDIQYRTMAALERTGKAPLAPLIGYEADASVLGSPFFAMGFVGGEVPIENPPYTQQGFFVEAAPEDRRRMIENGLRVLARVHEVDWQAAGLQWLVAEGVTPGVERQIDLWQRYALHELRDRVHPLLDEAFRWLRKHLPQGLEPGFGWGDARLGNIIWRDFEPVCITDFENVAITPPEVDLGWWLMFDQAMHESMGQERLPGEPTREEQRDFYAGCAGRDVGDTHYFEVLGAARYAAIVVRVMNRAVDRQFLPPDQQIWLHNPASTCLADLLHLPRP
ncbi:MAG: phosphotransferase family protein [Myxococcota bacterium]|nr:phosphotransferase family protein [Myxococcota bacterium]